MSPRKWIFLAAILGALGVSAGAIGAHLIKDGLRAKVEAGSVDAARAGELIENLEIAVRYHMYHVLALALAGMIGLHGSSTWLSAAGWAFVAGMALFSGFLYGWVLTGGEQKWMVHVVPVGGTLFILGWILLGVGALAAAKRSGAT